jgi:hypothetical protein
VRSSGGFSSHLRQPARNAQRDVVSTERCIPNGMRISKSGSTAKKHTKTLFTPYLNNKTTLVAKDNIHILTLLAYCSFVFNYFRINSVELRCASVASG